MRKMFLSFFNHLLSFFQSTSSRPHLCAKQTKTMATQRLKNMLNDKGLSLTDLCDEIERSENESDLKLAFNRLNEILETLGMIAPLTEPKGISFATLRELKYSKKLAFYLNSELSPDEAFNEYKRAVVKELAVYNRKRDSIKRRMKTFEDNLFRTYFPQKHSQTLDLEHGLTVHWQLGRISHSVLSPCRKRGFSEINQYGNDECTETNPDSMSGKIYPTGKGLGKESKKRRCGSSTYRGRSPNLASRRNDGIVEYTETNPDSMSRQVYSGGKGIGKESKKRRCGSSTSRGPYPNLPSQRNEENCTNFANRSSRHGRKCKFTHDY